MRDTDNTARLIYFAASSGSNSAGGSGGKPPRPPRIRRANDHAQRRKPDMSELAIYMHKLRMQANLKQQEAATLATQAGQPVSVDFIHDIETQARLGRKGKIDYLRLRALVHLYAEHGAAEASWDALDRAAGGYTPLDVRQASGVITTGDALASVVNLLEPEQQTHLINYVRMLAREARIEAHLSADVLAALPERYASARRPADTSLTPEELQQQHDVRQAAIEDTLKRIPHPTDNADEQAQGDD